MSNNVSRAVQLHVYSRQGCHLCEDMLDALQQFEAELGYSIVIYDIDEDDALCSLYNALVPVVFINEQEIFRYYFELATLRSALSKTYEEVEHDD